jgi:hypothetical protein
MTKKQIKFENLHYETLFLVNDGDQVTVTHPNGDSHTMSVKYLDDTHFSFGNRGVVYHIHQFAETMARTGSTVAPNKGSGV